MSDASVGRPPVLELVPSAGASSAPELSSGEAASLLKHEQAIDAGLASFLEVGLALAAIRDRRLYRATHSSFEQYLRERWGLARAHAYRQIQAAQVARLLSPNGDEKSPPESVLRELAPLRGNSGKVTRAWNDARVRYGERPTAKQVRQVVEGIAGRGLPVPGPSELGPLRLTASAKATAQLLDELKPSEVAGMESTARIVLAEDLRSLAAAVLRVIKSLEAGTERGPSA